MRTSDAVNNNFKYKWQGSHDTQIKDTVHDEIMVWLYGKIKNDHRFLCDLFPRRPSDIIDDIKVRIEHPIQSLNKMGVSISGFVDLNVNVFFKYILDEDTIKYNTEVEAYYEKHGRYEYCKEPKANGRYEELNIEVKSNVNIGETIRQIKYYSYGPLNSDIPWAVCAPDFANKSILIDQGIKFIEYRP